MRRKIAKQREETIYRQQELRQNVKDSFLMLVLILLCIGIVGSTVYWVGTVKLWW